MACLLYHIVISRIFSSCVNSQRETLTRYISSKYFAKSIDVFLKPSLCYFNFFKLSKTNKKCALKQSFANF